MTTAATARDTRPLRETVIDERDYVPLANTVPSATADTSILLDCPGCRTMIWLGPLTGAYDNSLPWLASLCPTCGARFRVVQRIEITWQPGAAAGDTQSGGGA